MRQISGDVALRPVSTFFPNKSCSGSPGFGLNAYMEKAARQYPDIYTAEVVDFGNTLVFVNHPKGIEQVLSNDTKEFALQRHGAFNLAPANGVKMSIIGVCQPKVAVAAASQV